MAKITFNTADEYIASMPQDKQAVLQKVRAAIRKGAPDAEEVISYSIPAFKYRGWIWYYSIYTKHVSLSCPPPWHVFEAFKDELAPYTMSKSTIQFPLDKPLPLALITKMAKFRANENKTRDAAPQSAAAPRSAAQRKATPARKSTAKAKPAAPRPKSRRKTA
jgi:uncharacterized protein YdhG (YjbR/CyaY superfamily)